MCKLRGLTAASYLNKFVANFNKRTIPLQKRTFISLLKLEHLLLSYKYNKEDLYQEYTKHAYVGILSCTQRSII